MQETLLYIPQGKPKQSAIGAEQLLDSLSRLLSGTAWGNSTQELNVMGVVRAQDPSLELQIDAHRAGNLEAIVQDAQGLPRTSPLCVPKPSEDRAVIKWVSH